LQLLQEQQADTAEAAALVAALEAVQGTASDGGSAAVAEGLLANGSAANGHAGAANDGALSTTQLQRLVAVAAPALTVQQTDDAGRGLAAAEDLPAGRDVLIDQPFVWALTKLGRRSVGF
jgi:hypothetical protein